MSRRGYNLELRGSRNFLPPVIGPGTSAGAPAACQAWPFLCVRVGWPGGPRRRQPSAWRRSLGQGTWGHSPSPTARPLHAAQPPHGSGHSCPGPPASRPCSGTFGPLPPLSPFELQKDRDGAPRGPSRTPGPSCPGHELCAQATSEGGTS